MPSDEIDDHRSDDPPAFEEGLDEQPVDQPDSNDAGERVGESTAQEVDQRIVDLLSWILDTETRAKIYVHLLANPGSTSEEVAKGTGLYPSTVREALAELHEEERVSREKRTNDGAGNNPYEYTAIQPSELVGGVVDQVQQELNTIFTLDRVLTRDDEATFEEGEDPVTITVDEADDTDDDSETLVDDDSDTDDS